MDFIPRDAKPTPPPEPSPEHKFSPVDGTAEDWANLKHLVVQIGDATAHLNAPQQSPQEGSQQEEPAKEKSELQIWNEEKRRNLDPAILVSAQLRLAELEAQAEQERQQAEAAEQQLDAGSLAFIEALGGAEKFNEMFAQASAEMAALGAPTDFPCFFETQTAMDVDKEEDYAQRWEHVHPGFAAKMKKAEDDSYYRVIDSRIAARQQQLVAQGACYACDALQVEVRVLL